MFPASFVPTTTIITPTGDSGSLASPTSIHALYHKRNSNSTSNSNSKTILFLHGYPQNSALWYLTIEELEKVYPNVLEEYDIIIPDLPG